MQVDSIAFENLPSTHLLGWFLKSHMISDYSWKMQRVYLPWENRGLKITGQMFFQVQNTAHFSCNLITLSRYFHCFSWDRFMWPIISFGISKVTNLGVWENGFHGSYIAMGPAHSCIKCFLDAREDDKSFWESVDFSLDILALQAPWSGNSRKFFAFCDNTS